jgi:Zn-dependent protease with chaperone function
VTYSTGFANCRLRRFPIWAGILFLILACRPCVSHAETLYWILTEAQIAGRAGDLQLRDKGGSVVASVPVSRLRTLLEVKKKIASAAGQYGVALAVSNDKEENASAGRLNGRATVIFTIPMLNGLGDDEQLVAAIMAHEFGHLAHNHTGRAERSAATTTIGVLAGIAAGLFIRGQLAANLAANAADLTGKALVHSYDRNQEREADAFGIDVMAKAGYDPEAAVRFWSSHAGMNRGGLFSTHPASAERLANVQQLIATRRNMGRPGGNAEVGSPGAAIVRPPSTSGYAEETPRSSRLDAKDEYCIVVNARAECGHNDFTKCEAARTAATERWPAGSSCVQKAVLDSAVVPSASTATTESTAPRTHAGPATFQPVRCHLADGAVAVLPLVQCVSRGGIAE